MSRYPKLQTSKRWSSSRRRPNHGRLFALPLRRTPGRSPKWLRLARGLTEHMSTMTRGRSLLVGTWEPRHYSSHWDSTIHASDCDRASGVLRKSVGETPVYGNALYAVINRTGITQSQELVIGGTLKRRPKVFVISMNNVRLKFIGFEQPTLRLQGASNHEQCHGKMCELFVQPSEEDSLWWYWVRQKRGRIQVLTNMNPCSKL